MDEERPQEPPADVADLGPDDGALIVFTSGTTGEPRGALHAQRYLAGQRAQAEHWLGAQEGELVWCTTADRVVEVGPQRVRRAVALRRGGAPPRRPLRPRRAPGADRARAGQRPLPGADRVPDARQARAASAPSLAAPHGLGRRGAQSRGDRGLPGRARPRHLRRLRPDGDRPPDREPGRRRGPRRLDGQAPAGLRGSDRRRGAAGQARQLPDLLQPLPGRRAVRRRVVADGRRGHARTTTATSGTRGAATT